MWKSFFRLFFHFQPAFGPFAAAIGGGLLSIGGGLLGNRASAKEAARNRDFQQYNSDTAYQRAANDMGAAGLNRILAATQGGAGTPVGSMAAQHDPITPGVHSGLAAKLQAEQIKNIREQTRGVSAQSDVAEFNRDYEEQRYTAANAVTDKDGNVNVTPMMRTIIREELEARLAAAKAGRDMPGQQVELTKMQTLLKKLEAGGQDLTNQEKTLLVQILKKEQPGHLDAAGLWSSSAGNVRRRADFAAEGVRKWLPWGGHGSARSMTIRQ